MGRDRLPRSRPVVHKLKFCVRTPTGATLHFRRLAFHLISTAGSSGASYIAVHYVGSEKVAALWEAGSDNKRLVPSVSRQIAADFAWDDDAVSASEVTGVGLTVEQICTTRQDFSVATLAKNEIVKKALRQILASARTNMGLVDSSARNRISSCSLDRVLRYPCPHCDRSFSLRSRLNEHAKVHTSGPRFRCKHCTKCFQYLSSLRVHEQTHEGSRPFECQYCLHRCSTEANMRSHIRTHTGERPYVCTECLAAFAQPWNLREHKRTHTGERAFECDICTATFTRRSAMRRHRKLHERERTMYPCADCGQKFFSKTSVYRHNLLHSERAAAQAAAAQSAAQLAAAAVFENLAGAAVNVSTDNSCNVGSKSSGTNTAKKAGRRRKSSAESAVYGLEKDRDCDAFLKRREVDAQFCRKGAKRGKKEKDVKHDQKGAKLGEKDAKRTQKGAKVYQKGSTLCEKDAILGEKDAKRGEKGAIPGKNGAKRGSKGATQSVCSDGDEACDPAEMKSAQRKRKRKALDEIAVVPSLNASNRRPRTNKKSRQKLRAENESVILSKKLNGKRTKCVDGSWTSVVPQSRPLITKLPDGYTGLWLALESSDRAKLPTEIEVMDCCGSSLFDSSAIDDVLSCNETSSEVVEQTGEGKLDRSSSDVKQSCFTEAPAHGSSRKILALSPSVCDKYWSETKVVEVEEVHLEVSHLMDEGHLEVVKRSVSEEVVEGGKQADFSVTSADPTFDELICREKTCDDDEDEIDQEDLLLRTSPRDDESSSAVNVDVSAALSQRATGAADGVDVRFTCGLCETTFGSLEESLVCFYSH